MNNIESKTWIEQLVNFQKHGMKVDLDKNCEKMQHISYYRFKEVALPLATKVTNEKGEIELIYENISFDDILTRYYQTKNLRMYLFHALDKIEVSVKTQLSYILGKNYGKFGYLNFPFWCNKEKNTKDKIKREQAYIKKEILRNKSKSSFPELKRNEYLDEDGFPVVWLAIDILSFGPIVSILELLNTKLLKEISEVYGCNSEEFLSWMKCLNFIRNLCAHNGNIVNLSLTTKPKTRNEWSEILLYENNKKPTNKLAVVILIIYSLISAINPNYNFSNIFRSLKSLCGKNGEHANLIGFKDKNAIKKIAKVCKKEQKIEER